MGNQNQRSYRTRNNMQQKQSRSPSGYYLKKNGTSLISTKLSVALQQHDRSRYDVTLYISGRCRITDTVVVCCCCCCGASVDEGDYFLTSLQSAIFLQSN
ncbi:hypothetical protein OCU04_010689 [Sclerotinia nivalis]|uniref:Uncharacterized protein n=1 Tax=Sclerotinia nivalis TaxID=352851 RepID=A0A9X0ACM3_9HELO|nr:hypothetical protein OCU04_010689 [Sclerotinia nivalis]